MPTKPTNKRAFNYDIASLLAYPPPQREEVVMTISGMTGENWNGMGNGSHALNGTESVQAWHSVGGTTTWTAHHRWSYGSSYLKLAHSIFGVFGNQYTDVKKWRLAYQGGTDNYTSSVLTGTTTVPSITALSFSSTTISGVTFTWSQGSYWSKGSM